MLLVSNTSVHYFNFQLRESKGMNTIKFRPHAGEVKSLQCSSVPLRYSGVVFSLIGMAAQAGDVDHLAATFLLCHSISHGINLRKSPVLQYLYYLGQVILPVLVLP